MTREDDEDAGLDRMMSSMRPLWRDLPDEEPSPGGLDALMAAARTKAAEMAPPPPQESWWRRTMAMLVRPPMLAAATVLVLIGSTVVLSRRSALDVPVTKPESAAIEKAQRPDQGAKQADAFEVTGQAQVGAGSAAPQAPVRPPAPVRPRPPIVKTDQAIVKADPVKDIKQPVVPESKPTDANGRGAENGLAIKNTDADGEVTKVEEPVQPTTVAPDAVPGRDRPTGERPTASTPRPPPVSSEQLLKQAETAAGRKDCPAVRATVERIRRIDDKLYKSRVVTQPAIKRCL